jgi:demethylmenaquinone methyltransferase/2-methoxy-6-polyprenyl-1,4-benzoquinol methylase
MNYAERASEYERVYDKPERHEDRERVRKLLCESLRDKNILEIACGTGYWTQPVSHSAASIVASDINEEVLQIARQKAYPPDRVRFQIADAFRLDNVSSGFDAGFAMFWWSHISRTRIPEFLSAFHNRLAPGATVVFVDNLYIEGNNNPMSKKIDADGNTYSLRRLENGKEFEIIKNFPTDSELRKILEPATDLLEIRRLTYYWIVSYRIRKVDA